MNINNIEKFTKNLTHRERVHFFERLSEYTKQQQQNLRNEEEKLRPILVTWIQTFRHRRMIIAQIMERRKRRIVNQILLKFIEKFRYRKCIMSQHRAEIDTQAYVLTLLRNNPHKYINSGTPFGSSEASFMVLNTISANVPKILDAMTERGELKKYTYPGPKRSKYFYTFPVNERQPPYIPTRQNGLLI
tara:strand:- start:61 stop:627 length:567 start_codon:yes stop_codon:yes gene_type:complete